DAGLGEFLAERLGQADHARFGGRIGRGVRIAFLTSDRGDVDDPPIVAHPHPRYDGTAAQENPGKVDVDDLPPGVDRIFRDRQVWTGDAGAGNENVDRTEQAFALGDRGSDGDRIADVDLLRDCIGDLPGRRLGLPAVDVPQRHLGARFHETLGNREADTARATGDDGDAT